MAITEIKEGELVLARLITVADAWGDGLKFFSSDGEYQQVGTWGYNKGKTLLAHSHNQVRREVMWTQEVLYVRTGRLRAQIFDTHDQKVAHLDAGAGDLLILLLGGHGYEILEDGTEVLEIKNGPYLGPETDRRRFT